VLRVAGIENRVGWLLPGALRSTAMFIPFTNRLRQHRQHAARNKTIL
jgi:hypothetical protein